MGLPLNHPVLDVLVDCSIKKPSSSWAHRLEEALPASPEAGPSAWHRWACPAWPRTAPGSLGPGHQTPCGEQRCGAAWPGGLMISSGKAHEGWWMMNDVSMITKEESPNPKKLHGFVWFNGWNTWIAQTGLRVIGYPKCQPYPSDTKHNICWRQFAKGGEGHQFFTAGPHTLQSSIQNRLASCGSVQLSVIMTWIDLTLWKTSASDRYRLRNCNLVFSSPSRHVQHRRFRFRIPAFPV